MSQALKTALALTPLPKAVVEETVTHWGQRYGESLALNPTIGAHIGELGKVSTTTMVEAIRGGNAGALAMILDGRERRSAVVTSALESWRFSALDVTTLAGHLRSIKGADVIVRGAYPRVAQEAALGVASENARIEWLARWGDEEACWEALVDREDNVSWYSLLGALLVQEGLRVRALHSGDEDLVRAACWTELPLECHEFAGEFALAYAKPGEASTAMAGLLNQPGLDLRVRERLTQATEAHVEAVVAAQRRAQPVTGEAVRSPRGIWRKGLTRRWVIEGRIRDISDIETLDNVVKAASMSTMVNIAGRERAVTLPLLYELSRNPHLGPLWARVLTILHKHRDWGDGHGNVALAAAAANLRQRADVTNTVKASRLRVAPERVGVSALALKLPVSRLGGEGHVRNAIDSERRMRSDMALAAAAKRLGNGSSQKSREAWRYFFVLLENTDAVSVEDVVNMAAGMSQADTHD